MSQVPNLKCRFFVDNWKSIKMPSFQTVHLSFHGINQAWHWSEVKQKISLTRFDNYVQLIVLINCHFHPEAWVTQFDVMIFLKEGRQLLWNECRSNFDLNDTVLFQHMFVFNYWWNFSRLSKKLKFTFLNLFVKVWNLENRYFSIFKFFFYSNRFQILSHFLSTKLYSFSSFSSLPLFTKEISLNLSFLVMTISWP